MAVDDPFTDFQRSHASVEPSSPFPKRHILLAPILETQGEEELLMASSNPPPFVLALSEGNTNTEQHPPAVLPPAPLPLNPVHYQYPLPYFPYPPPNMYHGDPCAIYGVHHPRNFPDWYTIFPDMPYADPWMQLDPARSVACNSFVEPHQLHHPSAKAK